MWKRLKIEPFRSSWASQAYLGLYTNWQESFGGRVDFEIGLNLFVWIFGLRIYFVEPDLADRMAKVMKEG